MSARVAAPVGRPDLHAVSAQCEEPLLEQRRDLIDQADDQIKKTIAWVLIGIAVFMIGEALVTLFTTSAAVAAAVVTALGTLLFAYMVAEIAKTMHEQADLRVTWFLKIGIAGAVREILCAGADLSLDQVRAREVSSTLLHIGVSLAVVVGLSLAMRLVADGEARATGAHERSRSLRRRQPLAGRTMSGG